MRRDRALGRRSVRCRCIRKRQGPSRPNPARTSRYQTHSSLPLLQKLLRIDHTQADYTRIGCLNAGLFGDGTLLWIGE